MSDGRYILDPPLRLSFFVLPSLLLNQDLSVTGYKILLGYQMKLIVETQLPASILQS